MSQGGGGTRVIARKDQEAVHTLLEPTHVAELSERERIFVLDLAERILAGQAVWTRRQQQVFHAIRQRVLGEGGR